MIYKFKVGLLLLLLFCASDLWGANKWLRGAVLIGPRTDRVHLHEFGNEPQYLESGEVSTISSGNLILKMESNSSLMLHTSNCLSIYLLDAREFTIERFEQKAWDFDAVEPYSKIVVEPTQSRMISSFSNGVIAIDGTRQSKSSQFSLETPIGTIWAKPAYWVMEINYDQRKSLYRFSIELIEGNLKFVDRRGLSYPMNSGQRLVGVGSSVAPTVELGELLNDPDEILAKMIELNEIIFSGGVDWEDFSGKMTVMSDSNNIEKPHEVNENRSVIDDARPIIIEYEKGACTWYQI